MWIKLSPCACLHNYIRHENDPLMPNSIGIIWRRRRLIQRDSWISLEILSKSRSERVIGRRVLYRVDHGKIRPSKSPSECNRIHAQRQS